LTILIFERPTVPHTLTASGAKKHFADALRRAESGEVVLVTRFGKPSAALIDAERLERLAAGAETTGAGASNDLAAPLDTAAVTAPEPLAEASSPTATAEGAASPQALLEQAAAASLRRIDYDLAHLPETLRPLLRLIRRNLFHPRLTVERIKKTLKIGAHNVTSRFRKATGAPIRSYLEDRRLETASRLLLDCELSTQKIGRLVGYSGSEALSRAFKRRYGTRPRVYRQFGGKLAAHVASEAATDRAPQTPRFLAGFSQLTPEVPCTRCGDALRPENSLRVFDQLAPICPACARRQAPELAALL